MLNLKYTFKTGVFSHFFLLFSLLLKIGVFSLEVSSVHRGPYTTIVNEPLETVTPLSIFVILTINLNCLKLRYSKNPP
jgi:hypothetical protein